MFKNYVLTAFRNLTRHRYYTLLNICGLAIGITCAVLILLFVMDEISYDKHHKKYKRIYRLESHFVLPEKEDRFAVSPIPIAPSLKDEYPEIEDYVRIQPIGNILVKNDYKEFYEDSIAYADSSIFKIFSHKLLIGNPEKALVEPFSIVLTTSLARKYFLNEDPYGKILIIQNNRKYKVTGVMEDLPHNSHLKYNALLSFSSYVKILGDTVVNSRKPANYWSAQVYSYILLKENTEIKSILAKFPEFYNKNMASIGKVLNASFTLMATRLDDIHLNSKLQWDQPTGNKSYIYIFILVAAFILIIAGINYMNMATARSSKRSREVGIRKVLGAYRKQLIFQFISESVILSLFSLLIAIGFVELILPTFNNLADKQLSFNLITNFSVLLIITGITLFVGIFSGSYPAFFLSAFKPVQVLKTSLYKGTGNGLLRKVLVIFQFAISIIMIIGTIIISSQIDYIKNKDLGFNKDNIMVVQMRDTNVRNRFPIFREELIKIPSIINVATSSNVPSADLGKNIMRVEGIDKMKEFVLSPILVDENYINLMEMKIQKGRNFSKDTKTDEKQSFLINETAAKKLGWGNNTINKKIEWGVNVDGTSDRSGRVIGVVKDFHYQTLQKEIEPVVFAYSTKPLRIVNIKMKNENIAKTIENIKEVWEKINPSFPFDYTILDKEIQKQYSSEEKLASIFKYFSILTIFISCLGLLGLSSFIAEQKTKEIGIRKVLGASLLNILQMLYKEFAMLLAISLCCAAPIAYYFMNKWLQNFTYHTKIYIFPFIISGIIAFTIALLVISYHAFRAAFANPVNSLKYE